MKNIILLSLLTINLFSFRNSIAQSSCDNALYEADKLYESGKFQECINTLQNCAANQRNKEFRMQSYRLLALAYLNLNNDEKARENIKYMLKAKPDYQKYPNIDPVSFSRLLNEYLVSPKVYGGIKFGFNINSIALLKSYSTYVSPQSYNPSNGFQFGITSNYLLKPTLSIQADLLYSGVGIKHVIDNAGGWKQNYSEQQKYVNLNLGIVKQFAITKKINAHAGLGIGIGFMRNADVYLESVNIQTETIQQASRDAIKERNRLQLSGQAIAGFSYPAASGILSLDAGFGYYFMNSVNADKRMDDLNFIFNNQYVNDDIKFRLFSINISYKLPLVWETKLKK